MSSNSTTFSLPVYQTSANTITLTILISLTLTLLFIHSVYHATEVYEEEEEKLGHTISIVHPTFSNSHKVFKGGKILVRDFLRGGKTTPVEGEGTLGEERRSLSHRETSGKRETSIMSIGSNVLRKSVLSKGGKHISPHVLMQIKMHKVVRRWVTEREETKKRMNGFTLKFKDISIEEQFNYYYLYLHKNYVRGIVAFIFLSVTSSIPYFIYNLYLRLLILGLLMLTLYFNNTIMMDEAFWIADWGMGACWMFLGLSGMGMLAFDEVAGENRTQNTSSLHPLVGAWIIYTAAWSNLTGTVWRKKVMLILVCMVTISVHLLTNLFGREYLNGMEGYAPRLDFDNVQAVVLLGVLTIAVLIISWIVEGHIRMQFMNSWDLLLKKIEQEELLQKQRFSVEQLEIIRNIMENKNEDIDLELQEVLISSEDLQLEEMLGKGAYGEVFKAQFEGIHVAVKVIKDISEDALERTRAEILLMKGLHHPQIVMFIGACWDEFMMGIVLELVENGPMANFLHNKKLHLSWEHPKLQMAKDAAAGCLYLHNSTYYDEGEDTWHECIIHRDLKPDNMLVTTTYGIKLTDFGEARAMDSEMTMTQVGSPLYMAPEVLRGERYDERVDVYSYAVTLLEMLVVEESIFVVFEKEFKRIKGKNMALTPLALTRMVAMEHFRPHLPDTVPKELAALISDCWKPDPNSRPSFDVIMNRLDNEVHEEIYSDLDEDGAINKSMLQSKIGKKSSETRGARKTMEATRDPRNTHNTMDIRGAALGVNFETTRAGSSSNIGSPGSSGAPPRRGMHLKKMMSVKRHDISMDAASGGNRLSMIGKGAGSTRNFSMAAAASVRNFSASRGAGSTRNFGGATVAIPSNDASTMHSQMGESQSPSNPDASLQLMQNKNALAKTKAENDSLKKELEKMKKELEENKKRAENAATQLKLAQKNARQARMDMNEKRKEIQSSSRRDSSAENRRRQSAAVLEEEEEEVEKPANIKKQGTGWNPLSALRRKSEGQQALADSAAAVVGANSKERIISD